MRLIAVPCMSGWAFLVYTGRMRGAITRPQVSYYVARLSTMDYVSEPLSWCNIQGLNIKINGFFSTAIMDLNPM